MKIIVGIWMAICFAGLIFTVSTIESNILLSLVGLIPLAITAAVLTIADRY